MRAHRCVLHRRAPSDPARRCRISSSMIPSSTRRSARTPARRVRGKGCGIWRMAGRFEIRLRSLDQRCDLVDPRSPSDAPSKCLEDDTRAPSSCRTGTDRWSLPASHRRRSRRIVIDRGVGPFDDHRVSTRFSRRRAKPPMTAPRRRRWSSPSDTSNDCEPENKSEDVQPMIPSERASSASQTARRCPPGRRRQRSAADRSRDWYIGPYSLRSRSNSGAGSSSSRRAAAMPLIPRGPGSGRPATTPQSTTSDTCITGSMLV